MDGLMLSHNERDKKFIGDVNDDEAFVEYTYENGVYNFYHTFTPESLRGKVECIFNHLLKIQGIAAHVGEYALIYARENNWKVILGCSYLEHKFAEEFKDITVKKD